MVRPVSEAMISEMPAQDGSRRAALAVLARAKKQELAEAWDELTPKPAFETLRPAESGLVMARARIGGGGPPFNAGEVAVTRCVVRMDSGEIGFGHVLGRDKACAELVARFDALLQSDRFRSVVETGLLRPVAARQAREDDLTRRKTAATRVNFFTMVRGEDE